MEKEIKKIFKKGSKTYYYSSLFFPKNKRIEVSILYAFVRVVDDYVDSIPQKKDEFYSFLKEFQKTWQEGESENIVIHRFVKLAKKKEFKLEWINSFFEAMESDFKKLKYYEIEETKKYMVGSAEVIGLMMAKIMNLKEESFKGARALGASMQYINFIRDLKEDIVLGRQYLPINEMKDFSINSLKKEEVFKNKENFILYINKQLQYYKKWQKKAQESFSFIPFRYRIPIETASLMYNYTAKKIKKNPLIVYKKKVKPKKSRIIIWAIIITIKLLWKKIFLPIKKK